MGEFVLRYWIQAGFGILLAGGLELCRRYRGRFKDIQCKHIATELGVRAMLRHNIIVIYHKYSEKGSIPFYELENVEDLFLQYTNLNGNGAIKELMERIRALDITKL